MPRQPKQPNQRQSKQPKRHELSPAERAFRRLRQQFPTGVERQIVLSTPYAGRLAGLLPAVDGIFRLAERLWAEGQVTDEENRRLRLDWESAQQPLQELLDRLPEVLPSLRRSSQIQDSADSDTSNQTVQPVQATDSADPSESGLSQAEIRALRARQANAARKRQAQEFLRSLHAGTGRKFWLTSRLGIEFCDQVVVPVDRTFRLVSLLWRDGRIQFPVYERLNAEFSSRFAALERGAQAASSFVAVADDRRRRRASSSQNV